MPSAKQNQGARDDLFSLSVDRYGRLWLHSKLEGVPVSLDLADKDVAFEVMAAAMRENDFERRAAPTHEDADNDDQQNR